MGLSSGAKLTVCGVIQPDASNYRDFGLPERSQKLPSLFSLISALCAQGIIAFQHPHLEFAGFSELSNIVGVLFVDQGFAIADMAPFPFRNVTDEAVPLNDLGGHGGS
jgi:hypothetical protein